MSAIIPFQFEAHAVRVQVDDQGQPWFNATDVCDALEMGNPSQAIKSHVDAEDLQKLETLTAGGRQRQNHVNESGLYALILGSTKDAAKRFKRWVTQEVLPSIRKTGSYAVPGAITSLPAPTQDRVTALLLIGEAVAKVPGVKAGIAMAAILRNMKAARQVEAVELMIASNTITVAHAEALLKATPPEQRTDVKSAEREKKTAPIEQIEKLEKEMSQVQEKYQEAESNYGSDLLNLVVAKGYLTKLLANGAVKSYIGRHEPEILTHLELVVNTVSMEEAVQQQQEAEAEA